MLRSPVDSLCCALFPASCRLCGDPLLRLTRIPVCDSCWNLPEQSGLLCAVCGEALGADPSQVGVGMWCRPCQTSEPPFKQALAHGVYQDKLRALLHLLKYDGMEPVASRLGELLAQQVLLMDGLPERMVVVPVPLFKGKRKQRGFNQSSLLARGAVRALRSRRADLQWTMAEGLLERRRATESQAGLTPHQRRANMRGAFFVPRPERLKGTDVLLIDDIYTTGATARACAQALRKAGARSVRVATVARAQRQEMIRAAAQLPAVPMHEDVAFWDGGLVPAVRGV